MSFWSLWVSNPKGIKFYTQDSCSAILGNCFKSQRDKILLSLKYYAEVANRCFKSQRDKILLALVGFGAVVSTFQIPKG